MKAQSSIEFMTIVGIALVVIAPVVTEAMDTISSIDRDQESTRFQSEMNDLEDKVTQVVNGGEKTIRTDQISMPDNVKRAKLENQFIIITVNRTRAQNITRVFRKNITGNIPTSEGVHSLKIENLGNSVQIHEVKNETAIKGSVIRGIYIDDCNWNGSYYTIHHNTPGQHNRSATRHQKCGVFIFCR